MVGMFFLIGIIKKPNGTLKSFAESLDQGARAKKEPISLGIGPFYISCLINNHVTQLSERHSRDL